MRGGGWWVPVEGLEPLGTVAALLGDELVGQLASKHLIQQLLLLRGFEAIFKLREQIVEELVSVHLLSCVYRFAIEVLNRHPRQILLLEDTRRAEQDGTLNAAQKSDVS